MKKTTKIFALLLAVLTVFSAFSISGFAVATELEAGNSLETATNIPEYDAAYVSALSTSGEADWFKFTTLSSDAYYTINFTNYNIESGWNNTQKPCIWLYDAYKKELSSCADTSSMNIKLENDTTYYLLVQMGYNRPDHTGNYEIKLSYKYDPAPNDMENSVEIGFNNQYEAALDGYGDVDFYKFTTPVAGVYKMSFINCDIPTGWNETQKPNIFIYDKFNQTLSYVYSSGEQNWEVTLEANQTYYLKICMGYNSLDHVGNYKFSINYDAPVTLTSIVLASAPSKTEYIVGDTIDVNGLSVEAAYSDGTKKIVEGYSITGFDSATAGTKTVTITYTENEVTCTCTFDVIISEPAPAAELTGIAYITLPDKTSYKVGESFDKTGLVVSAQYSDGTSKLVTDYTVSGFNSSSAGTKTVTVSYSENGITKTCKFNVTVVAEKQLIAISVASMPTKTVYQIGEAFDASGLVVNAFYDDGTSYFVTDYTVSGFDSETAGTKTVIVSYSDKGITKSCSFEVTVEEPAQTGSFFTNLIDSIMNFFMSIIIFLTNLIS